MESDPLASKRSEDFSQEDVNRVWKAFSENWKDAGDTDRLILNKELEKGEGFKLKILLTSQLEVSFLEKFELQLIQYLRTSLINDHITIDREFVKEEPSRRLYTSKDIFDHMVKENPNLWYLKDRLGLDFEY